MTVGTYLGPVGPVSELTCVASAAGKISRDHCREYGPTTARAGQTAVSLNSPLGWLVIAASAIIIGKGWLNTRAGNDYLLTSGTHLGSIGAVV